MANIRTSINKSVMGNKRVNFGTALYVNGQTTSEIDDCGLRKVESFIIPQMEAYTVSGSAITITHSDPGAAAGTVGWMAIGY